MSALSGVQSLETSVVHLTQYFIHFDAGRALQLRRWMNGRVQECGKVSLLIEGGPKAAVRGAVLLLVKLMADSWSVLLLLFSSRVSQ